MMRSIELTIIRGDIADEIRDRCLVADYAAVVRTCDKEFSCFDLLAVVTEAVLFVVLHDFRRLRL